MDEAATPTATAEAATPTATAEAATPTSTDEPPVPTPAPTEELPTSTPALIDLSPTPTDMLPTPTELVETPVLPTETPVPEMPNLVGLDENQAREALAELGAGLVVVDYQGQDRLGDLYGQFPPSAVVSHTPPAGAPATPGMLVTLGVRAP